MTRFRFIILCLLAAAFFVSAPPANAAPAFAPVKPQVPSTAFKPIVEQLGQQFQSLVIGTAASTPTGEESDESNLEPTPTFGTKALNLVISLGELLRTQGQTFIANFAALPQLSGWYNQQVTNPHLQERWTATGNDFLYVIGLSFLFALAIELLLYPVRRAFRQRHIENARGTFITIVILFLLRAIPILVFVASSATLLDQIESQKFARFIILNVVYALTLSRVVITFIRGVLAPNNAAFRLTPLSDSQALYGYRWLCVFSILIIFAYFVGDVARAAHVPNAVINSFANILGFVLVLMTIFIIAQKRAFVAVLLRGRISAANKDLTLLDDMRLWLARTWHMLAILYLIIGYAVAALGVANGFALILRGTVVTLLIFAVMNWLFGAISRWGARDTSPGAAMHHAILRFLMRAVIWVLTALGIAAGWGADITALFATPLGQRVLGSVFSISVTIIIVACAYEVLSSGIERHLSRRDEESKTLKASARALTLLPMIRNAVFISFAVIVGLVMMSEAGFNIGPLLAGAGVVGVAVGFGSQTLVKDFLTGLFIVVENTIAIGDVVTVGTHSGVVEAMSVRTLRLRDMDGALHILPFSEVTQIINMTRGFAYAQIAVGVAYDTDLERAMSVIRSLGEEMQKDPIYKRVILEPIEVLGVDKLGDSSITLLARLRTRPGKQWDVKRMFMLKLVQRFAKEGIDIPFPIVTNVMRTLPTK
jgi:moderate conductance mechanosensitive channel